jgi:hypothetical protein
VPPGAAPRAADLLWNTGRRLLRLASPHGIRWWPLPGRWLPRLPTRGWLLSRGTGEHRRQGPPGLVHPWPQEPPVPPGGQCLVLGVHGCDNSWSRLRICPARFLLRSSDARPARRSHRPMRSIKPARRGGHDRARCPTVSAVRTGGSRVLVVVRCPLPAQQPRRPRPNSCAISRSVPRRSARQPARPAGSSQGPPGLRTRPRPARQQPTAWKWRLPAAPPPMSAARPMSAAGWWSAAGSLLAAQWWSGSVASSAWPSRSVTR